MKNLYEILVPRALGYYRATAIGMELDKVPHYESGIYMMYEIPLSYHKEWDDYVINLTGGSTILKPVKGNWMPESKEIIEEEMIPVRIACDFDDMIKIANFTKEHYHQDKVMFYELSRGVYLI